MENKDGGGVTKSIPKRVKEAIDFMYELVHDNDWVEFNSKGTFGRGTVESKTTTRLVKRGILLKKCYSLGRGKGAKFFYKWNPDAMAPTKTLYNNIVNDIKEAKKEAKRRYKQRRHEAENAESRAQQDKAVEIPPELLDFDFSSLPAPTTDIFPPGVLSVDEPLLPKDDEAAITIGFVLSHLSDQQLWDELKKRGYSIEDNRLVIIKKAYLT